MIKAKIVADSINEFGDRITTMLVTMPRYILAEFNTHRMFSRNTASSRAIPFVKMVRTVSENPFIPIAWQIDHKGMQGNKYITKKEHIEECVADWLQVVNDAVEGATRLNNGFPDEENPDKVTKQLCNRLLEPFMWTTVLVTATEWENFFALRCPQYEVYAGPEDTNEYLCTGRSWKDFMKSNNGLAKDFDTTDVVERLKLNKGQAEIHMMALAEAMWDAYNESVPEQLKEGQWHIPFWNKMNQDEVVRITKTGGYNPDNPQPDSEIIQMLENNMIKISTVMAARTSYTVVGEDQKPLSYERMIEIHDELLAANPKHMSPFEHCAKVMTSSEYFTYFSGETCVCDEDEDNMYTDTSKDNKGFGWLGNFRGFIQYRKTIPNENITK